MVDQEIRVLEILKIVHPPVMFASVLFFFGWSLNIPLVVSVTFACLAAIFTFTIISVVLAKKRKDL